MSAGEPRPLGPPSGAANDASYSAAANPTSRPAMRRILTYGVIVVAFLVGAAVLAYAYDASFGLQVTLVAALFAALPLFVVVPTYLWLDRYEAEPNGYLVVAFLWGAICAAAGALFLNTFFSIALALAGSDSADTLSAVISAPLVEEGLKGLGILLLVVLRRRQFDGIVDGLVYAGLVGAGFAFSENILYLGNVYAEHGSEGLTVLFVLRCVMGPFAHPLFTSMTGIGLGVATSMGRSRGAQVLAGVLGYVGAVLLHFLWNLSSTLAGSTEGFLGVYFAAQVPIFLAYLATLAWARNREGRQIRLYLSQYADAGWLGHDEVAMLGSLSARRAARAWARTSGGRRALTSMRAFQDSASDLALLRSRIVRGAAEPGAPDRERLLLESVAEHRADFTGAVYGARVG